MGQYNRKEAIGVTMNRFFFTPEINENEIIITGNDVHHIKKVLRLKVGAEISLCDKEKAVEYYGVITDIGEDSIRCELRYVQETEQELPAKVYLFQALPKADKMELVIQKAVELGIHEIIPVAAARSVVRLDEKKAAAKIKRWQGISEAAAKQSKRGIIPAIREVMSFAEAIKVAADMDLSIIPYEMAEDINNTRNVITSIKHGQTVAIFIGPEGGFAPEEIALAKEAGVQPITMGKRILRTETAALVILSWIMYHLEE
jgi:16S rRNA (uracil1498-N3)-methyltransferase